MVGNGICDFLGNVYNREDKSVKRISLFKVWVSQVFSFVVPKCFHHNVVETLCTENGGRYEIIVNSNPQL